jgi:5'-3' exonuclease
VKTQLIVYNFFRGIRPLVEKYNPDLVYFVLEGRPKHRIALSGGNYKDNRPSQGENFHKQKASIIGAVKEYLPFVSVRHPEFECDDVIATYVIKHFKKGDECFVISSDSDFIQLHNICNFTLYNPVKKKEIPKPDYDYVAWKALRGDPTDNIPGIPRVGDKTALKLVNDEKLLREFLNKQNHQKIFEKNVDLIRLVDLSNSESEMEITTSKLNTSGLKEYFSKLGFETMIKEKTWEKYIKTFEVVNG